jgi:hypothetical protein
MPSGGTAQERYAELQEELLRDPSVRRAEKRGFGSSGLFAADKLFVMWMGGGVAVKLPPERVDELSAAGVGTRFEMRGGRAMRQWIALDPSAEDRWRALAEEAKRYVISKAAG